MTIAANDPKRFCIVLARADIEKVWDGKPYASDLGQRAGFVDAPRARTVMWLLDGGAEDVAAAESFAATEGYRVFTYSVGEADPFARAKAAVLREAETAAAPAVSEKTKAPRQKRARRA